MWALTRRPIQNAEALRVLESWKVQHSLQSDCWALPRHLPLFRTKLLGGPSLRLPASLLCEAPVRAAPLAALASRVRSQLLRVAPPPADSESVPMTAHLTADGVRRSGGGVDAASIRPSDIVWRPSTLDELFDAAQPKSDVMYRRGSLLCGASLLASPPEFSMLTLVNAQETGNPFALDPHLTHTDAATGLALPDALASTLTTIAAQFRYRSFRWVEVQAAECGQPSLAAAAAAAGVKPHAVPIAETLLLAHVAQLPVEEQCILIDRLPRYALPQAAFKTFVFKDGQWGSGYRLGLCRRLRHQDIPRLPLVDPASQPLLWVVVESADLPGIAGAPLQVRRSLRSFFFNEEQLKSFQQSSPQTAVDRLDPVDTAPAHAEPLESLPQSWH